MVAAVLLTVPAECRYPLLTKVHVSRVDTQIRKLLLVGIYVFLQVGVGRYEAVWVVLLLQEHHSIQAQRQQSQRYDDHHNLRQSSSHLQMTFSRSSTNRLITIIGNVYTLTGSFMMVGA